MHFCGYMSTDVMPDEKLAAKLNIYHDLQPTNEVPPADIAALVEQSIAHSKAGGKFEVYAPEPKPGEAVAADAPAAEKPKRGRKPKAEKAAKPPKAEKKPKAPKPVHEGSVKYPGVILNKTAAYYEAGALLQEFDLESGVTEEMYARLDQIRGEAVSRPAAERYLTRAWLVLQGAKRGLAAPVAAKEKPAETPAPAIEEPTKAEEVAATA